MKKGWEIKKLGDVCEIIKGRKPALNATSTSDHLPYLVAKVIRGSAEPEYASVKDRNSITVEEAETIIICDGSNSGEVFTGFRGILSSTMGKIAKKAEIDDDYLRAFLASTFEVFNGAKTGAAIPHLDKEAMYQLQFPLPPLPEQRRIVAILDEAFAGIAQAKAHAEKNLQNARELFESHLNAVFSQRGDGWEEKRLQDICEKITDGTHQTPTYFDDGVIFLSSRNVTSGRINWDKIKYIDDKQHKEMHKRVSPRVDDILLAKNGTTGVAAIVNREVVFDIYVSLALIRTLGAVLPRYLLHFINSPAAKRQFNKRLKGIGVPNLHLQEIREVLVAFPVDTKKQCTIVGKIDALSTETQRLESIYQRKLTALEELKKSLLHQGFSGGL